MDEEGGFEGDGFGLGSVDDVHGEGFFGMLWGRCCGWCYFDEMGVYGQGWADKWFGCRLCLWCVLIMLLIWQSRTKWVGLLHRLEGDRTLLLERLRRSPRFLGLD